MFGTHITFHPVFQLLMPLIVISFKLYALAYFVLCILICRLLHTFEVSKIGLYSCISLNIDRAISD